MMKSDLSTPWQWQDFPDGDTQLLNSNGVSMIEGAVVMEYQKDCDTLKRLILAAPDLLNACKALLKADDDTNDLWALEKVLQDKVIPLARAAVAKASGKAV